MKSLRQVWAAAQKSREAAHAVWQQTPLAFAIQTLPFDQTVFT